MPLAPEECGGEACPAEGQEHTPAAVLAEAQPAHTAPLAERPGPVGAVAPQASHTRRESKAPPAPRTHPSAHPAAAPAEQPPSVETWPLPWREAFAKAAPAPLLWTYGELALDLAGKGDKARSGFLRAIIGALSLPRGSSVFWPPAVLDETGRPAAEPALFLAGLNLLAPKVVILLGASAIASAALPLSLNTPYTQQIFQGRLYILLPEFSVLLQGNSAEQACAYLRSAFSQIPTLFHSLQG